MTHTEHSTTTVASGLRAAAVDPTRGRLMPVPASDVVLRGGFWGDRQERNAAATIAHAHDWMERLGWIANFDRAAGGVDGAHLGREFSDSEVYKLIEAMAWEIGRSGSADLERRFAALTARVIAAQQPDGYVNTRFGGPGQDDRYSDLEWGHELYCAGHLIQAGVARARTAGVEDEFVRASLRVADHVVAEFGPDARDAICGHPEIELALVELYRVTSDRRYLDQAALFLTRRGRGSLDGGEFPSEYFLDDRPVADADVLHGHAVRATYLAAGAVDVAVETEDDALLEAVVRQWQRTVARRTYITGGLGSRHEGESIGDDFELPSDRAYSETCAGIGSLMVSWRLLLARGELHYGDLIERVLYNVIATSPDEHGTAFFYVNPLQRSVEGVPAETERPSPRAASSQRAPWFEVSCCPTNEARTLANLGAYVATVDDGGLQVHQFASTDIRTTLPDGSGVALSVATRYPDDGRVVITVIEAPPRDWALTLRIPAWADGARAAGAGVATWVDGGVRIAELSSGDVVELTLPVTPRVSRPDPHIDAIRDSLAIEAGPLVYCLESIDLPGIDLSRVRIASNAVLERGAGDIVRVHADVVEDLPETEWPYARHAPGGRAQRHAIDLIPYHRWAERGPSTMRVWLPLARE